MNLNLFDGIEDIDAFVSTLDEAQQRVVFEYIKRCEHYRKYTAIEFFEPDAWQVNAIAKGFHEPVRGCLAGNRLGKSYFGTYETAVHLTGRYPKDWKGHKFDEPINAIALGIDFTQIAKPKAMMELLLGTPSDRGSGWIPKEDIVEIRNKMSNVAGTVLVKHYNSCGEQDGVSRLDFGSYNQGDEVIMGAAYHWFLIDECPTDDSILEQCKKRQWSLKGKGRGLCVFTPEKGANATVNAFWDEKGIHHTGLIHVTLWDSSLYTPEEKKAMNDSIAPWQRAFSIEGRPTAGTGAVFAGIMKDTLLEPNMQIQPSWKRIAAIDWGFQDPNVVGFFAKDPNTGAVYMYDELMHTQTDASYIAPSVKDRQHGYIPMIWPADGCAEKGTGDTLVAIYKRAGVICTDAQARNWELDPEGKSRSIGAGLMYLRDLMQKGLFKVHPRCTTFLKEFDQYAYGMNGKPIDKDNHAIDMTRYGVMALNKFGVSELDHKRKVNDYDYVDWSEVEQIEY